MATLYITHPTCRLHDMGQWHPECPTRLDAIDDQLLMSGVANVLDHAQTPEATDADILRVHTPEYLRSLQDRVPESGRVALDADTVMNPYTMKAARVAAGAGLYAVDEVMAGRHATAFCSVRPPGHHATPSQAM